MRHRRSSIPLLLCGALALAGCAQPLDPPLQQAFTLRGTIYRDALNSGTGIHGARVTVRVGDAAGTAKTGFNGRFEVKVNAPPDATSFDLAVEPPKGTTLLRMSYDGVPLERGTTERSVNVYVEDGVLSRPAEVPRGLVRHGCVTGQLTSEGRPVASNAPAIIPDPADETGERRIPRPVLPDCDREIIEDRAFIQGVVTPPNFGETGVAMYGGIFTVRSDADGRIMLPAITGWGSTASSGSLWAGNFDATDTGDRETARAAYWSKFQYVPNVNVLLSRGTITRDLALEPFDPAVNARVTELPVRYDTAALRPLLSSGTQLAISTVPAFIHSIASAPITLGAYAPVPGQETRLRVYHIPRGAQGQQILVQSEGYVIGEREGAPVITGLTASYDVRDGSNLQTPLNVPLLGVPSTKRPGDDADGVSRTPTLEWTDVPDARSYAVSLFAFPPEFDGFGIPVWRGFTTRTQAQVPFTLEPNTFYAWRIDANDTFGVAEAFGAASGWASRLPTGRVSRSDLGLAPPPRHDTALSRALERATSTAESRPMRGTFRAALDTGSFTTGEDER